MAQISNTNPLARYFRKPAIYIRLPSNGDYWPTGSIEMPQNRELPVYPMTAADEITYRTPDALFNGQATVGVIQSCFPNIKNAWLMPTIDLYSILISLRVASYGNEMEITTTCPACQDISDYGIDLRQVIESLGRPDYSQPSTVGDVQMIFRPLTYKDQNEISMIQYENNRLVESVQNDVVKDMDKMTQITAVMRKLTDLQVKTVFMATAAIKIPDSTITDRNHIFEFLQNCDLQVFAEIRNAVMRFKGASDPKPMSITCPKCNHVYEQALEFDQSTFFGQAS